MSAKVSSLSYPVLRFVKGMVFPARDQAELTECQKIALTNGFFRNQLIVDSNGNAMQVKGARKIGGVGPFWGYNIFLNQRIRVELELENARDLTTLESVRTRIMAAFRSDQGWNSSGNFDEVVASIEQARDISELVNIVTSAYYRVYDIK